jgi:hypothetical protein
MRWQKSMALANKSLTTFRETRSFLVARGNEESAMMENALTLMICGRHCGKN